MGIFGKWWYETTLEIAEIPCYFPCYREILAESPPRPYSRATVRRSDVHPAIALVHNQVPLIRGLDIKVILGSSDPRQQLSSLGISRLTGLRNRWHAVERRRVFFALEVPRVPDTLAELIKVEVLSAEVILSVLMGAA